MIHVFDNIMSLTENDLLYNEILYKNTFSYGELDKPEYPPTGMIFELSNDLLNTFYSLSIKYNQNFKNFKLQRAYVNLFTPNENPFFHQDGNVITNLFYVNPQYDLDEGGETQFFVDNQIIGILPKPARLVVFDGTISHKATSFRTKPRITVALKFNKE